MPRKKQDPKPVEPEVTEQVLDESIESVEPETTEVSETPSEDGDSESAPPANDEPGPTTLCRVLHAIPDVGGHSYKPNDLVSFPVDVLENLEERGLVSSSEANLAYCESVGAPLIVHPVLVEATEEPDED